MITEGGSDWRKAITIRVDDKSIVEDTLKNIKFSGISWKGNDGYFFTVVIQYLKESQLSSKTQLHTVYYHKVGTPQSKDVFIFGGEKQPNRYVSAFVTEDQNYLIISAATTTSGNKLFVQPLKDKNIKLIGS